MIEFRRSKERGHFNLGWLHTYHSFSFGDYFDPKFKRFRDIRVINQDLIMPGQGFPLHSHNDMEIVTFILEGELAHKDSLGNKEVLSEGMMQFMNAGTEISHSEYNPNNEKICHLMQIWLFPKEKGTKPFYQNFKPELTPGD